LEWPGCGALQIIPIAATLTARAISARLKLELSQDGFIANYNS
jgi:hypothetical protein